MTSMSQQHFTAHIRAHIHHRLVSLRWSTKPLKFRSGEMGSPGCPNPGVTLRHERIPDWTSNARSTVFLAAPPSGLGQPRLPGTYLFDEFGMTSL